MSNTPNCNMPYILSGQAQKEVTHNEALNDVDTLMQISVLDRDLTAPPASPNLGDRYIIAASATGAWNGQDGKIAAWYNGWRFKTPAKGWLAFMQDENKLLLHNGTSWQIFDFSFMGGTLPISNGGTDAVTASAARTNLGAVAKAGDTLSGALSFPAGSAASPSAVFGTGAGFYNIATNVLGVSVNGAELIRANAQVVGIGTGSATATAGARRLDIGVSGAATYGTPIQIWNTTDGRGSGVGSVLSFNKLGSTATTYGPYIAQSVGVNAVWGRLVLSTETAHEMVFATNNAEIMRLDSTGRMLFGHSAALAGADALTPRVQTHGATQANATQSLTYWANDAVGGAIQILKSRGGSIGTHSAVQANDVLGSVRFGGSDGTTMQAGASFAAVALSNYSATNSETEIRFGAAASGSTVTTGRLCIRAAAIRPLTDNAMSCGLSGSRWTEVFAVSGTINTSDARDKTAIADLGLGLDFINALRPVAYKWKISRNEVKAEIIGHEAIEESYTENEMQPFTENGETIYRSVAVEKTRIVQQPIIEETIIEHEGSRTHFGLLAQEVKAALDAANAGNCAIWTLDDKNNPDSRQGMRTEQLIPILIKAVQQLSARVAQLEEA